MTSSRPIRAFAAACALCCTFGWAAPARADVGVGAKPEPGAEVLFDGSRAMLEEKWTYWEGPGFRASLPLKWKIVDDPVDGGTVLPTSCDPATYKATGQTPQCPNVKLTQ